MIVVDNDAHSRKRSEKLPFNGKTTLNRRKTYRSKEKLSFREKFTKTRITFRTWERRNEKETKKTKKLPFDGKSDGKS